jgi:hypothetical protein
MISLYVLTGVFFVLFNGHFNGYSKNSITVFGVIMILYGIYRFGKTIQQQNQKDDE